MARWEDRYRILEKQLMDRGVNVAEVRLRLKNLRIETPSWGYGDSGTRFGVFRQPAAARDIFEKLEDAACVHRFTGVTPSVALHIPWDKCDDWNRLKAHAKSLGLSIGAINPNLFQDECYKFGSFCNADPKVRRRAREHVLECIAIMKKLGSRVLSLWFADGTNYPGQGDFVSRKRWMQEELAAVYAKLPKDAQMLIEYKLFEPAFYHTDIADWGMAYVFASKLGPRAKVLVDLGHHAHGVNIEHLVAFLIDEDRLGGFHFNNRKYADDDLMTGSVNPYELFLICVQLAAAEADPKSPKEFAYMVDQSHNLEGKLEAMVRTVENIQWAYAQALLVDRKALKEAQENGDVVGAENVLVEAYRTDVFPLLASVRVEMGRDPEPLKALRAGGEVEKRARERGGKGGGKGGGLGT
ncbi:MAG: L-rhamnose isomerase [Planctomycetota bacterium]|nr:L-rhamnose isomerase [Planctomycetota bacterium]